MKNYKKMVEDYPSQMASQAAEIIPMQTIHPVPHNNTTPPFYHQYHNHQNHAPYPAYPQAPPQPHGVFTPPPPPMPQQHPYPQFIPQMNMAPVRIPNFAHGVPHQTTVVCPCCKEMVLTEVVRSSGKATYISALILCGISPLLALIPLCSKKKCKDVTHYCPNCGMEVGKKSGEFCG